jgi:hypothetical protein
VFETYGSARTHNTARQTALTHVVPANVLLLLLLLFRVGQCSSENARHTSDLTCPFVKMWCACVGRKENCCVGHCVRVHSETATAAAAAIVCAGSVNTLCSQLRVNGSNKCPLELTTAAGATATAAATGAVCV